MSSTNTCDVVFACTYACAPSCTGAVVRPVHLCGAYLRSATIGRDDLYRLSRNVQDIEELVVDASMDSTGF